MNSISWRKGWGWVGGYGIMEYEGALYVPHSGVDGSMKTSSRYCLITMTLLSSHIGFAVKHIRGRLLPTHIRREKRNFYY